MIGKEIKKLSDEGLKKLSPFIKKSCYDCEFLFSKVFWWCGSSQAKAYRGTAIPGIILCHFWKPDWAVIPKIYKTKENGYIKRSNKIKNYLLDKFKNQLPKE